ncbi:S-layer homology domain-containing protein [Deinococcus sp.]|uniref:S-layer homology domain-containing protein n=1 Tax=Deinococcus sp. TaxID=47478 RepID=UPI0025E1A0AE|nr:S-layer homology domain-containing protein [Deinococcus sp.]
MKKSLLALTAALAFGMAAAQDAAPATPAAQVPALTDVPAGHWAKDAIDKLVSQGIILGYPDGTFRGTQNLTRYEAAVIIARLLNQMGTPQAPALDPETLTSLQNAIQELAADLAALGVRVSDLEENAVTKDDFARLEQRVEELGAAAPAPTEAAPAPADNSANEQAQADLQGQITTNTDAITDLQTQISDFGARADDLQANYDTLRADVDDNASSIAALNDLTVLLNQDILNLQDRASAIEAAQADFVQRADFDNLVGRVTVVETKVTDYGNRITALEKNAFTIKPTITATYFVARADREMDIDRLFPGTKFSTGDDGDSATKDTNVDYVDLGGDRNKVFNSADGLYGFSTVNIVLTGVDPTTKAAITKTVPAGVTDLTKYTISAADKALGYTTASSFAAAGGVNKEGSTTLDFGIDFAGGGTFLSGTSANTGAYLTSAGGVSIKSVDVKFGITTNPSLTGTQTDADLAKYPAITDSNSYTYRPLFFYFKNGTATFTVGNSPVTVDFGSALKTKFSDYAFDNDKNGRGDGYNVTIDGSSLPVFGAFKPVIKTIYGSSRLANDGTTYAANGANGDYRYYRGARAEITPVGTVKLGVHYVQEAKDSVGLKLATPGIRNVVVYGADAHGAVAGFQIDSEYARSVVTGTPTDDSATARDANVFYGKVSGAIGPVKVYDLNYRTVSSGYDKFASISEANPGDGDNGSTAPYNRGDRNAKDRFNVAQSTTTPGQVGAALKAGVTLGPVGVGGYYSVQNIPGGGLGQKDANGIVDFGVAAKVNLVNFVTVRGGYYALYAGNGSADVSNSAKGDGSHYTVRADITPGLGLGIGAYYSNVAIGSDINAAGTAVGAATQTRRQDDNVQVPNVPADGTDGLFRNSRYNSYYTLADYNLTDQTGCGAQHASTGTTDTDAVGGALTFSQGAFSDKTCYSEIGAEVTHTGSAPNALIKNLDLRFGYSQRYRNATTSYSGTALYADGLYSAKLGPLNVNVKGVYSNIGVDQTREGATADVRTLAAGARVSTDTIDTIFKPSIEAQAGYLNRLRNNSTTPANNYTTTGLSYRAGVKFNDFLLPTAKLAVYYAGLQTGNRAYTPFTDSTDNTAGSYGDTNTGYNINQNGVYVEGNYYDLSFAYGVYNLSAKNGAGTQVALPTGKAAAGSTFKITYKVAF